MTLEKIITSFLMGFVTFLLPYQVAILSLFALVIINGIAKYIAVCNDEDVRFWQIHKILKRSESISYILFSICGYSIAVTSIALLEMVFFGNVGVVLGNNTITLTYLMITLCVTHVFGSIMKSVEDIVSHPLFEKLRERMPKWLQELFKPATKKR